MVTLRDGSSVTVRPVGQDDEASLQTFLTDLCANSLRLRFTHFVAEVLPENRAMLDVFRDGFDAHVALHGGIDTVEFPTSPSD